MRPTEPFVDGEVLPLAVHRAVPGDSRAQQAHGFVEMQAVDSMALVAASRPTHVHVHAANPCARDG
jgi:hypothetical protein